MRYKINFVNAIQIGKLTTLAVERDASSVEVIYGECVRFTESDTFAIVVPWPNIRSIEMAGERKAPKRKKGDE